MKRMFVIVFIASLSLGSVAHATVTPALLWSFGSTPTGPFNSPATYGSTGTAPSVNIKVYGESITGSGDAGNLNGTTKLFSTQPDSSNGFHVGTGIGPWNGSESFDLQDGITPTNILEIELDSTVLKNTSLVFLLSAGVGGDAFNVWTGDGSVNTPMNLGGSGGMNEVATEKQVDSSSDNPFTIKKDTAGTEFIAIQADCHYLLLDTITGTPASAPEPRFYGLLLVGMLGVGVVLRRRLAPQQAA
jgi:hypothetical protein